MCQRGTFRSSVTDSRRERNGRFACQRLPAASRVLYCCVPWRFNTCCRDLRHVAYATSAFRSHYEVPTRQATAAGRFVSPGCGSPLVLLGYDVLARDSSLTTRLIHWPRSQLTRGRRIGPVVGVMPQRYERESKSMGTASAAFRPKISASYSPVIPRRVKRPPLKSSESGRPVEGLRTKLTSGAPRQAAVQRARKVL